MQALLPAFHLSSEREQVTAGNVFSPRIIELLIRVNHYPFSIPELFNNSFGHILIFICYLRIIIGLFLSYCIDLDIAKVNVAVVNLL